MFVADAKAVLATAENYDHLTAIFGADAFIFPSDQPITSISNHSQNLYDEPKIHRISLWADGSVSEVTQSTKHAQITITAPTKAERLTLMGRELANVMREHQTTQSQE